MNREDVIRMAREAGFQVIKHLSGRQNISGQSVARFERFAALVAAAKRESFQEQADRYIKEIEERHHIELRRVRENHAAETDYIKHVNEHLMKTIVLNQSVSFKPQVMLKMPEYDAISAAVAAEREACARVADAMNTFGLPPDIAAAIRARGQT